MNPETTWSSIERTKRLERLLEHSQPAVVLGVAAELRHFKGDKAGALEVVNKASEAHYTEEDLTILETLASQAAIAIQDAHQMIFKRFCRDGSQGGGIRAKSRGSNFTFILPISSGQADAASRVFVP